MVVICQNKLGSDGESMEEQTHLAVAQLLGGCGQSLGFRTTQWLSLTLAKAISKKLSCEFT